MCHMCVQQCVFYPNMALWCQKNFNPEKKSKPIVQLQAEMIVIVDYFSIHSS